MPDKKEKNTTREHENPTIQVERLNSWDEFEEEIEREVQSLDKLEGESSGYISSLLFRGHTNQLWKLETTLERYLKDKRVAKTEFSWEDYCRLLISITPALNSLTGQKHDPGEVPIHPEKRVPPGYEMMMHIRHHGFPSPLLDWTRSPYVAAFFAFSEAKEEDVAIYSFLEYKNGGKSGWSDEPYIEGLGHYAETHRRHYQQQCEYTICYKKVEDKGRIYTSHEEMEFGGDQGGENNIMKKYIIPFEERKKVMKKLNLMNITAFLLFGSEESLMDMLSYREIEGKR